MKRKINESILKMKNTKDKLESDMKELTSFYEDRKNQQENIKFFVK